MKTKINTIKNFFMIALVNVFLITGVLSTTAQAATTGINTGYGRITSLSEETDNLKNFNIKYNYDGNGKPVGISYKPTINEILNSGNAVRLYPDKDSKVVKYDHGSRQYCVSPETGITNKIYYVSEKDPYNQEAERSNIVYTNFKQVTKITPAIYVYSDGVSKDKGYNVTYSEIKFENQEAVFVSNDTKFVKNEEVYNYLMNESKGTSNPKTDNTGNNNGGNNGGSTEIKVYSNQRLGGANRYETAIKIADQIKGKSKLNSVVLTYGYNFPDALSGSALANSMNAPILLTGKTVDASKATLNYINSNLDKNGNIYILGSEGVVPDSIINHLRSLGYSKFTRLGGANRYETNLKIVDAMKVERNKPVIIANSLSFADSLSASSISGIYGMPIFLVKSNEISNEALNKIKSINPSEIYIIGGSAVVSESVEAILNNISKVTRLGGSDRYETGLAIAKHFNLSTKNTVVANGLNFPDALTGSILASKLNAPILLVNREVSRQKAYLDSTNINSLKVLGGSSVVSDEVVSALSK